MSDINLKQYDLDLTGENPANLVVDESHTLVRQRNRVVALNHGAFYTESLKIIHLDTGYRLQPGIDFKVLQSLYTASAASNKSVCGLILIHNGLLHQNLIITYQCVGGDYGLTSGELAKYLNNIPQTDPNYSWWNTLVEDQSNNDIPDKVDVFDFHYLCMCIEKIRNTILWSNTPYDARVRAELEKYLSAIEIQTQLALDSYITDVFGNFLLEINKTFLGLGKVKNLGIASNTEMTRVIPPESRITDFEENKYITLNSLLKFKELVYERFVLIQTTNISSIRGKSIPPSIADIVNMVNGAIVILKSKEYHTQENIGYDDRVYPPETEYEDEYSVLKVNNNLHDRGGVYLFSERNGKRIYIAYHPNGNPANPFVWNKIIRNEDTEDLSTQIAHHVADTNNPHQDNKESVELEKVENLPVVTREEILSLQAVKKYMTMDALMLFFKTYMVDEKAAAADPRNDDEDKVMIIYTGQAEDKCLPPECPCPENPAPPPPPEPPAPEPEPTPLMVKLSQYANTVVNQDAFNDPYSTIDEQASALNADFNKFAMVGRYGYEDGTGEIEVLIQNNSYCAGYGDSYFTRSNSLPPNNSAFIPLSVNVVVDYNNISNFGDFVYPGQEMEIIIEGQAQKEYIAVIKMPGKIPKYIRGVFENQAALNNQGTTYGDGQVIIKEHVPVYGFNGFGYDTGSDAVIEDDKIFIGVRYLEDRYVNDFDADYEFKYRDDYAIYSGIADHFSHYIGSPGEYDPYNPEIPPPLVYANLNNHRADQEGRFHGTLILENLNGYGEMGLINDQSAFIFTTNLYLGICVTDGLGSYKTNLSRLIASPGTNSTYDMVTSIGHNAYRYNFWVDVSEIEDAIFDIDDDINEYRREDDYGIYYSIQFCISPSLSNPELPYDAITVPMKMYIPNNHTFSEKVVPLTVNGQNNGNVTLKRNNSTGIVSIGPYIPPAFINEAGITGDALSCVYFLEKDGEDPYVSLIDVYKEFNAHLKPVNKTFTQFINSYEDESINIQYDSLEPFNRVDDTGYDEYGYSQYVFKANLRAYKLTELEKLTNVFSEYKGNISISSSEFDSITKVRMVTWNDADFTCMFFDPNDMEDQDPEPPAQQ